MSILLDALRKSEKDQRKVEPPNIHTGVYPPSSSGLRKKGWVLLLIAVLFVGVSYTWYRYGTTDKAYEPPVTLASVDQSVENQPQAVAEGKTDTGKGKAVVANDPTSGKRTPVESYKSAVTTAKARPRKSKDQAALAANKPAANKPVANKAAANKAAARKAAVQKAAARKAAVQKAAARKAAVQNAAANKQVANKATANKTAAGKPANAKPAAAGQKKFRPQPPAPINYWELPDAIRAKVPEMKFTVLVYAQKPADRFVLIDGQRYRQGEQVQPELIVKQIQREGVVFKYRLYQFLVER